MENINIQGFFEITNPYDAKFVDYLLIVELQKELILQVT